MAREIEPSAGRAERDQRAADRDHVAVVQPVARRHALAVDVGAVARQAVVDDRPLVAEALERGVHARDLGVPVEHDLVARPPADRDPLADRRPGRRSPARRRRRGRRGTACRAARRRCGRAAPAGWRRGRRVGSPARLEPSRRLCHQRVRSASTWGRRDPPLCPIGETPHRAHIGITPDSRPRLPLGGAAPARKVPDARSPARRPRPAPISPCRRSRPSWRSWRSRSPSRPPRRRTPRRRPRPSPAAPLNDSGYWAVADQMQQLLDNTWDERRGEYRPGGGGADPMVNSLMLLTHSVAAMEGHEGPARNDHRARLIAKALVSSPAFITQRPAHPKPGSQIHAPGLDELARRRRRAAPRLRRRGRRRPRLRLARPRRSSACRSRRPTRSPRRSTRPRAASSGATRRSA